MTQTTNLTNPQTTRTLEPIGQIRSDAGVFFLELKTEFGPALKGLGLFSHVIVLWWADKHDNEKDRRTLRTALPYAENTEAGVFACRAEYRPNPIGVSVCKILEVDETRGLVNLEYIDAFTGSPLLDIKPYIPVSDRVRDSRVPEYFADWPDWYEEAGEFFGSIDWQD